MFYSEEDEKIYERRKEIITLIKSLNYKSTNWVSCSESELTVGDIICVSYIPDSQKYLYVHLPELGIVQEIEKTEYYCPYSNSNKLEYSITILNSENNIVNINKEHFSMYSSGYCMCIEKCVKS